MTTSEELPTLASLRSPVLGDNPYLRKLQAERPIWRVRTDTGDEGWLVVGYPEIKELMLDKRIGRTHPKPAEAAQLADNPIFSMIAGVAAGRDEHELHAAFRALLIPHFSHKKMQSLKPRVEGIVRGMVDELAALTPPVDLQTAFSLPVSLKVLCELMGVPQDERDRLGELLDHVHGIGEHANAGQAEFIGYLMGLAARKREDPGDDVISGICQAGLKDSDVTNIVCMLLFAGHESVATHIGNGVARLLTRPDLLAEVRSDPSAMAGAVEELLRTANFGGGAQPHYAHEDIEISGVTIRAGDLVLPDFAIANFDERSFADPERIDFGRKPNQHLTFAHGAWHCVGAPLARLELNAVFTALLAKFPDLTLTTTLEKLNRVDGEDGTDRLAASISALPVAW
ncbi:cytochrome P450 [Amycolatopsis sp. Hca4]|uniref:cytochrome P450 n=1 Tax=unclassified Amycolatopsis TaxID=2618356 RepID=UPI0015916D4B|nr:cytochrome P450 [Amycolatopsis sp. Hca4]QKV72746.1 cytochrome P450 [Amycolatopsis sp. Hca4]